MKRLVFLLVVAVAALAQERPRAREAGVVVGILPPGPLNAITDVAGVRVGQTTLMRGENVRTGVTVILPHGGNLFREKVPGAVFVGNGFGKLMGSTQIVELGEIDSPLALTSTLNVPRVADALLDWMLALPADGSIMIVIATDAPLDARNLERMGARAMLGLARTGAAGTNGSGDYAIAFSTTRNAAALVKNDDISPIFLAVIEATEEAIYNSLFKATDVKDVKALPLDAVLPLIGSRLSIPDGAASQTAGN
ncbi:MAG TPA: P1 family peptidase [Thermoanaerobaculia bacterium]|nr:P1 family peptidase [Thermoanaerobaculia bacterium]